MFSGHDYNTTETVDIPFNTFSSDDPSASVTATNLAAGDIKIHKDGSVTQRSSASGVTVSVDFDGITGCHIAHIDLSDNTDAGYYANGSRYQVRVEGITVDAATLNPWIGTFSVGCTLRPAIDGRTIGVESDGDLTKVNTLDGHTAQSANNNIILAHADYGLAKLLRTGADGDTGETLSDQIDSCNTIIPDVAGTAATLHATTDALVDETETILKNATYGLAALEILVDELESRLTAIRAGYLDNLSAGIPTANENRDAVWNAILTGATFNIATSAGRRVREIGAFAIESGTAQSGTLNSIKLAVTASDDAGVFNRNLIVLTENTGKGQTRTIVDYDAIEKVIIVDRDWRVIPDNTTAYQVVPDDTPLIVDHGVAQGGTSTTIKIREYASSVNNAYWCNIVGIIAGKGRGQARLVGSYNGTTKVITICGENWVEIPDTTSVYVMMPYGTTCTACLTDSALALINTEIDNALNTAIPGSPTAGSINEKIKALPSGIAKNVILPNLDIYMLLEDGITAATGKMVTGQIRKDAGSFTGLTNAITEVSGGLYTIADGIIQTEMNADKVTLKFTADGCRDTIMIIYPT